MSLELYTAAEVADVLRLNHQVVQRKLQAGEIPGYRIGREWRVEKSQLVEWLEQHSNRRAPRTADEKVIAAYVNEDGSFKALPTQRSKREVLLRLAVQTVDPS